MIELDGFSGYFFDINSCRIFSSHSKNFLKPKYKDDKKVFTLYKNGVPYTFSLFDILKQNIKLIAKKLK